MKGDKKTRPVEGVVWKELQFIKAKRGSISGQQHPDVWSVQVFFEAKKQRAVRCTLILMTEEFTDKDAAERYYTGLRIGEGT